MQSRPRVAAAANWEPVLLSWLCRPRASRSTRGAWCPPRPAAICLTPPPLALNFFIFLFRSQMLQQHGGGLPGHGERDAVGAAVPALELAVPPHAHLHRHQVPGAQRGALLLPQPREPEGRPVVLHLGRELQVRALRRAGLW